MNRIAIWVMILDLKHKGWGAKRITNHLNDLGIPSPNAGRVRSDRAGRRYQVSGKWNHTTVLELYRNAALLGIKEYGHRSEGAHRRLSEKGRGKLSDLDKFACGEDVLRIRLPSILPFKEPLAWKP